MTISKSLFALFCVCFLIAGFVFGLPTGGMIEHNYRACAKLASSVNAEFSYFPIVGCKIKGHEGLFLSESEFIESETKRLKKKIELTKRAIDLVNREIEQKRYEQENRMVGI